ncbi:hypothetical protein QYE76_015584 [Lolium multiflorum]|uniref:Uncharacterized protein n=1 Tax=Lolium multiflorum TaxID=4521 RepID=A0AAD8U534_LOLMU|nr:hypothetical protein QYE76_015584 [Lolium multiflorum]
MSPAWTEVVASPASSANSANGSGSKKGEKIGDLKLRLGIEDDEFDDVVFEEEETVPKQGMKWLALVKDDPELKDTATGLGKLNNMDLDKANLTNPLAKRALDLDADSLDGMLEKDRKKHTKKEGADSPHSDRRVPARSLFGRNEDSMLELSRVGRVGVNDLQDFHRALDDCDLSDLGYVGDMFTWSRGNMRSRLDKAVGNLSWNQMHMDAAMVHLEYNHSNQRPLLLDTEYYTTLYSDPMPKQNKFEAKWFRGENFGEIVKEEWEAAVGNENPIDVLQRLKAMHDGLHAWDQRVLRGPKRRLRAAQRELETVMRGPINPKSDRKKHEIANLIEKFLEQEEMRWNQRYFDNLFSTENNVVDPEFLERISPKVTQLMNENLIAPFTGEDVKEAVFSIGDLKAPRPDGLHALFYKMFWHLVGPDITTVVLKAINDKVIPEGWNERVVVLIPKVDNP